MTYAFLTMTFLKNPGYLPKWLRVPVIDAKIHPARLIRLFNLRLWVSNNIYKFEELMEGTADDTVYDLGDQQEQE